MSVLSMDGVSKSFADHEVLTAVSFSVAHGERLGVVGPNGVGKTTLLELASGALEPDSGSIHRARGLCLGHLRQELNREPEAGATLYSYCGRALAEVWELEEDLQRLEETLAQTRDAQAAAPFLQQYDAVRARYESRDGYTARSRLEQTLFGMGFARDDFQLQANELSGGQRVRAGLARLLLSGSDLLLLDEPTNHLDIQAMEWLEQWLRVFAGAVIMVAHDRRFLDRAANRILELRERQATLFTGNYSAYEMQRHERDARQRLELARKRAAAERLTDYIHRYKAGNRATMARSRERALERLGPLDDSVARERPTRVDLSTTYRSAREVFQLKDVGHAYADKGLFHDLNFTVYRGERWGIVGPNGCGKTTLLRVLAGELVPQQGRLLVGGGVKTAYYSQTGTEELPLDQSALEIVVDQGVEPGEARHRLARLGLVGEEVFKTVAQLSGGQKSRLLLTSLVLTKANVLLLDEPTNHLDLLARSSLREAILDYAGTLVLVTHDRDLLDELVDHLLVFEADSCRLFVGNYSAYREAELERAAQELTTPPLSVKRHSTSRRVDSRAAVDDRPRHLQALEQTIASLEAEKHQLELLLQDPEFYGQAYAEEKLRSYHQLQLQLEESYRQWERAVEGGEN